MVEMQHRQVFPGGLWVLGLCGCPKHAVWLCRTPELPIDTETGGPVDSEALNTVRPPLRAASGLCAAALFPSNSDLSAARPDKSRTSI